MKKSKILQAGAITLAVVLLFQAIFRTHSPFGKENNSFASEPGREITRIEFSEGSQKLFLEREGENWLINGKTEARKSGILYIIKVLQEIKIKSPVSEELFKREITGKGIVPVKVKIYQKGKLPASFIVYKTASNKYGNIMKKSEGAKPFIVSVPGFEGDIGSVFTLKTLYWEPFTVFNLLPSEIVSVNFQNFSDAASSFSIGNKNNHYKFSGPGGDISVFDSAKVTRYLSYFARIPLESWALELTSAEKKAIESEQPLYRITVSTNEGITTELTLWERMTGEGTERKKDTDRLFGKTGRNNEYFIMRYFDIDPLIKKRSYFAHE